MSLSTTFSKLDDDERQRIVDAAETVTYKSGEVIVKEGQTVQTLMIIKLGNVRVTRTFLDEMSAEFAGPLGPGEVVGEMSFLDGKGASATVIADGSADIYHLDRETVDGMLSADNAFAARFFESLFMVLARKLRATNQRVLPVPP